MLVMHGLKARDEPWSETKPHGARVDAQLRSGVSFDGKSWMSKQLHRVLQKGGEDIRGLAAGPEMLSNSG